MKLERQLRQRLVVFLLGVRSGLRLVFLSLQVLLGFQLGASFGSMLWVSVDTIRPLVFAIERFLFTIGKVSCEYLSLLVLLELSQVQLIECGKLLQLLFLLVFEALNIYSF